LTQTALRRQRWCIVGAVACLACAAVLAAQPAAGRYAAQWCVAVPNAQRECGPAEAEWRTGGRARVRISDIVYILQLHTSQVDVVLKHGAMQIDGFTAIYEWDGATLRFVDADKNVRYELRSEALLPQQTQPRPAAGR